MYSKIFMQDNHCMHLKVWIAISELCISILEAHSQITGTAQHRATYKSCWRRADGDGWENTSYCM